jgi:hypothetical protein
MAAYLKIELEANFKFFAASLDIWQCCRIPVCLADFEVYRLHKFKCFKVLEY